MALTGELSDLSLAELIEFFCNQRKSGRLKLIYSVGPGYFYLRAGSVVHARIGGLRGVEAVYYALTLPNASFTFSPGFEAPDQTINQPWTSVVLEGLRRMDEGIEPGDPFLNRDSVHEEEDDPIEEAPLAISYNSGDILSEILSPIEVEAMGEFLSQPERESRWKSQPWRVGAIAAVVLIVAVIGVPWGWYAHSKAAKLASEAKASAAQNSLTSNQPVVPNAPSSPSESSQPAASSDAAAEAAKRQREEQRAKDRSKAQEAAKSAAKDTSVTAASNAAKGQTPPAAGPKKVTVQVTYDENGRVTQASGGDPTALRIARQKRFPAGKAGSATITIPIN
jgi:Domain of unknown function (DUF4388)